MHFPLFHPLLFHLIPAGHSQALSEHLYYFHFRFHLLLLLIYPLLPVPHATHLFLPVKYKLWQDPVHPHLPVPLHRHIRAYNLLFPYKCLSPPLLSAYCKAASDSAVVWKQAAHKLRYIKKRDIRSQLPEASLFFFRSYSFYDSSVTIPRLLSTSYEAVLSVMQKEKHSD